MIFPGNMLPRSDPGPPKGFNFGNPVNDSLRSTLFADTTPTSRRIGTISAWLRAPDDDFVRPIFSFQDAFFSTENVDFMLIDSSGRRLLLQVQMDGNTYQAFSASFSFSLNTWTHFVCAFNTNQILSTNRASFYVNGSQISTSSVNIPQNSDLPIYKFLGGDSRMFWGTTVDGTRLETDLAFMQYVDGSAVPASSFNSSGSHIPFGGNMGVLGCYIMGENVGSFTIDQIYSRRWSILADTDIITSVPPYLYY